ncbi:hypothetical protein ACPXB3_14340 [Gordonia sp. DT219]|uniref:hypothetical protein n=1 Tax=Gordonia sp. DT219 TaxID=3416658 RepID=UPI003CE79D48
MAIASMRHEHPRRRMRFGTAAVALLSVLAIGLGMTMGEGQAQAVAVPSPTGSVGDVIAALANNKLSQDLAKQWRLDICAADSDGGPHDGGADCTGSTGVGVAVVLPTAIELVPALPNAPLPVGAAKVIGDGFQFALASGGGQATAISYLPLSLATAGASDGRTAYAFAVIGMADAWTTSEIPVKLFTSRVGAIPAITQVNCYGALAAAYAENVGACANVLGTFDVKLDQLQRIPQLQLALTDPTAVVFDPATVLTTALGKLLHGQGFTLSKDVARLSLGGDSILALTSDYGLSAPITIDWLGSTITIFPTAHINGADRPNGLALPHISGGALDTSKLAPAVTVPKSALPFGLAPITPGSATAPATAVMRSSRVADTVLQSSTPQSSTPQSSTPPASTPHPAQPTSTASAPSSPAPTPGDGSAGGSDEVTTGNTRTVATAG